MLIHIFQKVEDKRREHGRKYDLAHVLLFTVLAILCNANSYRKVHSFIKINFDELKEIFGTDWERAPAYTAIRKILIGLDSTEIEKALREYTKSLNLLDPKKYKCVGVDGKVLRGSFDNFQDQSAIQLISAFLEEDRIILAHEEINDNDKTNEIPKVRKLIEGMGVKNVIFTFDALHCQKKHSKP